MFMSNLKKGYLGTCLIIAVLIILAVLCCEAEGADLNEVAALRAELASTKAELNKIKYANVPAIDEQIKPALEDWKGAYGDTDKTQIYFNIRAMQVEIEQCKQAIRLVAVAINSITDPNDPNSLAARVEVLEDKVADMPVFEMHDGLDLHGGAYLIPCADKQPIIKVSQRADVLSNVTGVVIHPALKPDDPNEVKR